MKQAVLERYFGYREFRPGQETLIDGILAGRDVFGIMPTGGGKSVCYQVPALMLPGITLVVSPLISLMQDQVLALKAMGIPAAYINSTLTSQQLQLVYRNLLAGQYKIVYIAPERLDYSGFGNVAARLRISFLAVDEAHCISQWGQDFRPSYLRILNFVDALPVRPVIGAYTATATKQVREDVERILRLKDPVRVITGFDRPNLFFDVVRPAKKDSELLSLMISRRNKSGIIYCATRKKVESVCEDLRSHGFAATRYHAGLDEEERSRNQEDFIHDRCPVMVATNAFGMGIDKSNVSFVIHYNMPKSMEAYYQEAGRAGRDGTEADCILLFNRSDVTTARYLIDNGSENAELDPQQRETVRQQDLQRLEDMVDYCNTTSCLRGHILEYFGQTHPDLCGSCGNCRGEMETRDITKQAQMLLSCVKRVRDRLGYGVGITLISKVLRGSRDKKLMEQGLDKLSTYGLLRGKGQTEILAIAAQLEADGCLRTDMEHQVVSLTPKAAEVLYRGKQVGMLVRKAPEKAHAQTDKLTGREGDLFEVLRELRGQLAAKAHVPAYVVFSNATLQDMARKMPRNTTEFMGVSGVGELKATWYAEPFLKAIRSFLEQNEE